MRLLSGKKSFEVPFYVFFVQKIISRAKLELRPMQF
jgi:hypothetical protein